MDIEKDSSQKDDLLPNGSVVGGHYVIVECLSIGRKATYYRCYHQDLPERVLAIGVLKAVPGRDESTITRFKNGLASSLKICHPNVVRNYDYVTDSNLMAYTMEYAPNGSLDDRLSDENLMTITEVLKIALQLCAGLQAIHDAGMVHRDLRPKNVLFNKDGFAMISGFGTALVSDGPRLTSHGDVVGTVGYASPEYLQLGKVDKRSDIYAIGLILYEMITGSFPFVDANPLKAITARLTSVPVAPDRLRSDCPPALSEVVLKAMANDPAARYQSARELEQALSGCCPAEVKELLQDPAAHTLTTADSLPDGPGKGAAIDSGWEKVVHKAEPDTRANTDLGGYYLGSNDTLPSDNSSGGSPARARYGLVGVVGLVVVGILLLISKGSEQNASQSVSNSDISSTSIPAMVEQPAAPAVAVPPAEVTDKKVLPLETEKDPSPLDSVIESESGDQPADKVEPEAGSAGKESVSDSESDQAPAETVPVEPVAESSPAAVEAAAVAEVEAVDASEEQNQQDGIEPLAVESYEVVKGDTVSGLAERFSLSQEEIVQLNGIQNRNLLIEGEKIKLPRRLSRR